MLDLKIARGILVDGSGGEGTVGDVGIAGGTIVAVGKVDEPARRVVDAEGALVVPGFLDLHTHYDGQAVWDAALAPSSWHGVTTVLMGNCGVGFAPLRPGDADRLVRLMEGVEEIPGTVLYEGLDWRWESFADYLGRLDAQPHAIDVATQVPHDPVRLYVMGDRAARQEAATAEDVAAMQAVVKGALAAGAFGFSTGRTDTHRTSDGLDTPGAVAARDELVALASVLKDVGYRVLQAVSDFDMFKGPQHFDPEFDVLEAMARAAGRPLTLSTMERLGFPDQWKQIAARVERARGAGLDLRMQIAPRGVGVLNGLRTTLNLFVAKPTYRALMHLPHAELVAELRKPEVRARILGEPFLKMREVDPAAPPQIDQAIGMLDMIVFRMFSLGDPPNYEPTVDQSIGARAKMRGVSALEEIYDTLVAGDGEGLIYFPIFNYNAGNLDVMGQLMENEAAHLGLGDAGAHVGTIADAAWTTFFLGHWARDRARGKLAIGRAVKKITADPAEFLGLRDRGRIAAGLRADLNVLDWDRLALAPPKVVYDLPAGGRRLVQKARGYKLTTVAGVPILEDDTPTGATPGQVLRAQG
jgi:N-acyl-D-aspartate/D-glutamate deacylase